MGLRKYNFLMHPSHHTSTTSAEETIQALFEQPWSLGSGGQWATMTTGKTTTSSGPNGSQTRSWAASKHTKTCRSKSRKIKIKRGALNQREEVTSTASYPPRQQTRKALPQRKISSPRQRRTNWPQHLLAIPVLSCNSESNTRQQLTTVQPRTARLLEEERKRTRRRRRRRKMWLHTIYCHTARWRTTIIWATRRRFTTTWRSTMRLLAKSTTRTFHSHSTSKKAWTTPSSTSLSRCSTTPKILRKRPFLMTSPNLERTFGSSSLARTPTEVAAFK